VTSSPRPASHMNFSRTVSVAPVSALSLYSILPTLEGLQPILGEGCDLIKVSETPATSDAPSPGLPGGFSSLQPSPPVRWRGSINCFSFALAPLGERVAVRLGGGESYCHSVLITL
jgi:hypothetical protein